MAISLGSSRRRKRGEMLFRFESFCQPGYPAALPGGGAFRENVGALLGLAHLEAGAQGETRCWSFQLELHRHPPTVVRLFVVEEEVAASPQRQCQLCRHVGTCCCLCGSHSHPIHAESFACNQRLAYVHKFHVLGYTMGGIGIQSFRQMKILHHNDHLFGVQLSQFSTS